MTTLYKKDSKGKIRVLNISTNGAELIQESGLLGGSLVTNQKTCKSKNVGRSNETSGEQQAILEMESKIAEKLKEDYFTTIIEAETTVVELPMLAKVYQDHSGKIDWLRDEVFEQAKLDGMRAFGRTGPSASLTSREGTPITTMPHIIEQLSRFPAGMIIDGELYAHGLSFQENMTLIKKYRGEESHQIHLVSYDIVSNESFANRFYAGFGRQIGENPYIKALISTPIRSEDELKARHEINIANGYEGTIVRWGSEPYKLNGRSEHLLKYKDFIDIVIPILDIIPSDARPEWGQAIYAWPGAKGHVMGDDILGSGMKLSHEERKEWLRNKQNYIGKTAEVRFFQYSDTGVPRFPVTYGIRLDK